MMNEIHALAALIFLIVTLQKHAPCTLNEDKTLNPLLLKFF